MKEGVRESGPKRSKKRLVLGALGGLETADVELELLALKDVAVAATDWPGRDEMAA